MSLLFTLWIGMMFMSALVFALTRGFAFLDRRAAQWPALWALALALCVFVPGLSLLVPLLPQSVPVTALETLPFHGSVEALGLATLGGMDQDVATVWTGRTAMTVLFGFYGAGVLIGLLRLVAGRYRLRQITERAECADVAWQDDVLVSREIASALAWSPIGQARYGRIVLPQTYLERLEEAQILDVIAHERAHLARHDDECGLILRVLLCVCWTSPFAHALFAHWSQSTELRCDMAVTAERSPDRRKAYANTLIEALHIMAGRVRQHPTATFSTPRIRNEQMRLKHIMAGTRPAFKRARDQALLGVSAIWLASVGAMTLSNTARADPGVDKTAWNSVTNDIVSGKLTARFGASPDPFNTGKTRNHYGIDIAAPLGTPIYAPATGWIREATPLYDGKPNYGTVVVLETDGGVTTLFSHLDSFEVRVGQRVWKGDQIATVGSSGKSTGPHVHIETYRDGERVDPMTVWDIKS